jgi:alcohol dehydrogenase
MLRNQVRHLHRTVIEGASRATLMKALVYLGPGKKAWTDVPKPEIHSSTDAIVRITGTTICGTDLHILKGDVPTVTPGRILGHEGIGVVDSVGNSVRSFKKNDRVLISCITSCGSCVYCCRNLQAHCLNGGWILGNEINGTQAEYVRIPFADNSLYALPTSIADESVLCLSDALPTGFEVGVLAAKVQPGETVAIVGAGPVGLSVLMTAQFFTPSVIIMIDTDDQRLEAALQLGATHTINPTKVSSVADAIAKIRLQIEGTDVAPSQRLKPGVDVAVECVGIPQTFKTCQDIIAPGGRIANVGVHGTKVDLELQDLWIKNIAISTGLVSANTTRMLLKSVIGNKLHPEKLVTHKFKLSHIEEAYDVFGRAAEENAIKMYLGVD